MKKIVVIGFVGSQLDSGKGSGRWERWRPTVALTQREDVVVSRIELLDTGRSGALIEQLRADIASVSPETTINAVNLPITDPWDFEQVYGALFDFAHAYSFDMENEE